jgi:predicted metalloendopeptidase
MLGGMLAGTDESGAEKVNVVRHFDDWYRVYGVDLGDALYLDPQDRAANLF